MDTLTRALREAADDAPTTLGTAGDAGTTWHRGRRRLALARAGNGVGLLAVLVVVLGLVLGPLGVPRAAAPAGSTRDGVTSYPQRIGHQWWVRDLPTTGGPLAGVVKVGSGDAFSWQAVTPDGTRYGLADAGTASDTRPAVSPDGWRVAWFQTTFDRWIVLDRRTGGTWSVQSVGGLEIAQEDPPRAREHLMSMQSPAFFSPDGLRLAIPTLDGPVVFDTVDGSERVVPTLDQAAGWRDSTHLVGRDVEAGDDDSLAVVEWDAGTGRTRSLFRLDLPRDPEGASLAVPGQHWGRVHDDELVVMAERSVEVAGSVESTEPRQVSEPPVVVVARSLPDGRVLPAPGTPRQDAPAWAAGYPGTTGLAHGFGETLWVSRDRPVFEGGEGLADVSSGRSTLLLAVEKPEWVVGQVWAQDALDGAPTWTPFGTSTSWLAWWWQELVLAAVAVLAGWRFRRWWVRRPRPARGSGSGPAAVG